MSEAAAVLGFLFIMVLWAAVAYLVAQHANQNGRSGALWGVATFFLGWIVLVIYLLVTLLDG